MQFGAFHPIIWGKRPYNLRHFTAQFDANRKPFYHGSTRAFPTIVLCLECVQVMRWNPRRLNYFNKLSQDDSKEFA